MKAVRCNLGVLAALAFGAPVNLEVDDSGAAAGAGVKKNYCITERESLTLLGALVGSWTDSI